MNIAVKHNGSTITSRVISYNREAQICTSIGTLNVVIEGTYSTTISPFDTFDIHENGDFKVRYYVSDVQKEQPAGNIIVNCQDKSKYITDYFIPDTYQIDYPTYTRYWIEKFLTEAGVSYNFLTSSQGNLISNDTVLGLQSAYDQVMMLLQLSGWYMYFDGNGIAVIGTLDTDLASSAGHLGKTDILEIRKITDDKMLRNRAVVWGQYDVLNKEYAYADVTKHTPWNYDHNDLRTMVISNNNIPNKSSAYNIANILLKEFARATIEKHITAWGARDYNLGEMVSVNSNIWRGKGMITTFGVTMDRNGLVTNLILDERCPRLFGFFNFGDYVYVSTFGDGVWRKHIKFDPTWYNFSTGLTDLHITDLHINNGIYGSVGHSGQLYYANNEEGPWNQITLTGLDSSLEDDVPSGEMVTYVPFSGIMARAVVVDKEINTVKFGVDTFSGLNTGDYFLDYPSGVLGGVGSGITASGTTSSGGYRSWIVEYDPYTGNLVGGLGSGIYPVYYSGTFDFFVVDIENDGLNDYISVGTTTSGAVSPDGEFNFGHYNSLPFANTSDDTIDVGFQSLPYDLEGETKYETITGQVAAVYHNELNDERDLIWIDSSFNLTHIYRQFNPSLGRDEILSTLTTSPTLTGAGNFRGIYKVSDDEYRLYHEISPVSGSLSTVVRTWTISTNTISAGTTLATVVIPDDPLKGPASELTGLNSITIGNKIYTFLVHFGAAQGGVTANIHNYVEMYSLVTDMVDNSATAGLVATFNFEDASGTAAQPWWVIKSIVSPVSIAPSVLQKGNLPYVALVIREDNHTTVTSASVLRSWLMESHGGVSWSLTKLQETTTSSDNDFMLLADASTEDGFGRPQLDENNFLIYYRRNSGTPRATIEINGNGYTVGTTTSTPFYWKPSNVHPMFNSIRNEYLAENGAGSNDWWWIDSQTIVPTLQVSLPTSDYLVSKPFSMSSAPLEQFFWAATDWATSDRVILVTQRAGVLETVIRPYGMTSAFWTTTGEAIVVGNFFIDPITPLKYLYVDNIYPAQDTGVYLVLQRDGSDFHLIQQSSEPIRIDISNNSPVLTVRDTEDTFQSNFVFGQELTQVIPVSGLDNTKDVRDYRYALLETSSGVVVASGAGVSTQIVYVNSSGIFMADANTYSGGFVIYNTIPSGSAERIETSNYTYPGQFLFVTTSGDNPTFYQKDNDSLVFVEYSGIPDSRVTRIRLDDRY